MGRVARQRIEQSHSRRAARKLEANTTSPTHRRCPLLPRLAPPILSLDHNGSWRRDARTQPAARRFPIHRATALEANSPAGGPRRVAPRRGMRRARRRQLGRGTGRAEARSGGRGVRRARPRPESRPDPPPEPRPRSRPWPRPRVRPERLAPASGARARRQGPGRSFASAGLASASRPRRQPPGPGLGGARRPGSPAGVYAGGRR